ncbi:MAG: hypothetical protein ACRDXB_13980, partial [Actinomycetes bacterium]
VIASLLVVGFSLARPISERVSKPRGNPGQDPQYTDQQYYASRQYYTYSDQSYPADPNAAWPREDQAWGRHEPAEDAEEKKDQS